MSIQDEYRNIEDSLLLCSDLKSMSVVDTNEWFVMIPSNEYISYYYFKNDMKEYFWGRIVVRKTVWKILNKIRKSLEDQQSRYQLIVVYGYRSLEAQTKYFNNYLEEVKKKYPDISNIDQLREIAHRWAACPEVAGHPTWWAVDVTLFDKELGMYIDMGTEPGDYSTKICYTDSPEITDFQKNNRHMLQKIMMEFGFAPYPGEWWHFSYGDKEWAKYYNQSNAIYWPVLLDNILILED